MDEKGDKIRKRNFTAILKTKVDKQPMYYGSRHQLEHLETKVNVKIGCNKSSGSCYSGSCLMWLLLMLSSTYSDQSS